MSQVDTLTNPGMKRDVSNLMATLKSEALASGLYVESDNPEELIRRSDGSRVDVFQQARIKVLEKYAMQARAAASAGRGAAAASSAASAAGEDQEQAQAKAMEVASEAAADIANAGVLPPVVSRQINWVPVAVIGVGGALALYFIFRKRSKR